MLTGSMQFIHEMSTIGWGTADDFRKMADQMDHQMVGNRQMYVERSAGKLTDEKLTEMMKLETWLTAQECVDIGLADDILPAAEYKNIVKQMQQAVIAEPADPISGPEPDPIAEPTPPSDPVPALPAQNKVLNLFAAFSAEKG